MIAVESVLKDAEKIKRYLVRNNLYNYDYDVLKKGDKIYFPVIRRFRSRKIKAEFVDVELKKKHDGLKFKNFLYENLESGELKFLRTSYDVVGDIAIMEIPDELKKREVMIAEALLHSNKNVKTIVKKVGAHQGTFRTQKMRYLAGEDKKQTVHRENDCRFFVDVEKVYFSPRLGNERKIIAKKIRKDEDILVMFSGCAPYPIVFSRNSPAKSIVGVEINPDGHKFGLRNLSLNRIKNVTLLEGDVRKILPGLKRRFDRIVMPLPKTAGDYLDIALAVSKKGTVIHFYDFALDKEIPSKSELTIRKACKKAGLKYKIRSFRRCGQHAPRVFRVCIDFQII